MRIFSDPRVAAYETPGHPEAPFRVTATTQHLQKRGYKIELPTVPATSKDVVSVHSPHHWNAVQSGDYHDMDTPAHDGIDEISLISLAGCLSAFESALQGEPAFSLMRPPGHHAGEDRVSGFCYLNNMAIACSRALSKGLRVAVLDIDVHHGDGTEELALGKKEWLYVSLHQSPLYPGTGLVSRGNCRNYPLPPFTRQPEYLAALDAALVEIKNFGPDILGVSAGFDTYKNCPIAQMKLEDETYFEIGKRIAATQINRFAILEGGYAPELPRLIENFLRGFAA